mmetsp:Transcript_77107/g.121344  ORF Transcript_77107/g.121344 Transcript_77107/m.121344 type:complete len:228 (+) Transcript_77107:1235-1918(+)
MERYELHKLQPSNRLDRQGGQCPKQLPGEPQKHWLQAGRFEDLFRTSGYHRDVRYCSGEAGCHRTGVGGLQRSPSRGYRDARPRSGLSYTQEQHHVLGETVGGGKENQRVIIVCWPHHRPHHPVAGLLLFLVPHFVALRKVWRYDRQHSLRWWLFRATGGFCRNVGWHSHLHCELLPWFGLWLVRYGLRVAILQAIDWHLPSRRVGVLLWGCWFLCLLNQRSQQGTS